MFLDTVSVLKSLFALQAVSNFMIKCFLPLIQIILSFFFGFLINASEVIEDLVEWLLT